VLEYSKFYHLLRHFKPDFHRTLMIGGAGYSFPREYLRRYEKATIDVAEIDPGMTEIARRHFRLQDNARLNIIHRDARMAVNEAPASTYDVILMDAFGSLFSVPTHLTTVEAVTQFARVLKDDGVVIFNLGSAVGGPASGFLHAELQTYRQVFPFVHAFKVRQDYADEKLQNVIIVARKSDKPSMLRSPDPELDRLLSAIYPVDVRPHTAILTDDLAPVEYYNSIAQNVFLHERSIGHE
jgi:spermidine synthase